MSGKSKIHDQKAAVLYIYILEKQEEKSSMKIADKTEFERQNIFGTGDPNVAFAQYFHGQSYLNPLTDPSRCSVFLANVTLSRDAEITGYPSCEERRRTVADLYRRQRMVPGGG